MSFLEDKILHVCIICILFIASNLLMIFLSQVVLQSETIQELTKTSETLALLQEEASKLRKLADAQKIENVRFPTHRIFMFSVCFNFT